MRIGFGYDSHRFEEGRKLVLGGIEFPDETGLKGHSDADVLLHAIIDALLGAAALGDIGSHFPDTDPKWRDADSAKLLEAVVAEVLGAGFAIGNVDATVICERPKLRPKIDLTTPEALEALVEQWHERMPSARIVPVSAKENFNVGGLFDLILSMLPEGEPYYPKDTLTDKTLRFFASEIIREKIFLNYDKEVPYSVEIAIEEYREEPKIDRISATIYVTRDSQKGIIIGHKGEKLKRVGMQAREDLERFLDKKVFLQLFVKVNDDWRNNDRQLRRFGYDQE
jgi:2-C-methyl-D-erythritol 2,4-cyclodiphosphate synthase